MEQDPTSNSILPAPTPWVRPLLRTLGALFGVGLLVIAFNFGQSSIRLSAECDEGEAAKIGMIPVDFSKPGHYEINVTNRSGLAHGVAHILSVERGVSETRPASELMTGLKGDIEWGDDSFWNHNPIGCRNTGRDDEVNLFGFGSGPWDYRACVEITQGAPALAGKKQFLFARNQMCCGRLAVVSAGVVGCLVGLAAVTILYFSLRRPRRPTDLSTPSGE